MVFQVIIMLLTWLTVWLSLEIMDLWHSERWMRLLLCGINCQIMIKVESSSPFVQNMDCTLATATLMPLWLHAQMVWRSECQTNNPSFTRFSNLLYYIMTENLDSVFLSIILSRVYCLRVLRVLDVYLIKIGLYKMTFFFSIQLKLLLLVSHKMP